VITLKISHPIMADDLESYPDGVRCELHHGALWITAPPIRWHSRVSRCIAHVLERAGMAAYQEIGVRFGDNDRREPDVAVFKQQPTMERASFPPGDFLILVEVESHSSQSLDRILKPLHYARAGIPEYWRVERIPEDIDDALIHRHRLSDDGAYIEAGALRLSELESSLTPP
jgi:Uma2 family endonuclease